MEVQWNTGRRAGQIIRARVQPDGSILFVDISRGVDGLIDKPFWPIGDENDLRETVMDAYDHNRYRSTGGSWMYLMHPEKVT
jgi:hypothetical protein